MLVIIEDRIGAALCEGGVQAPAPPAKPIIEHGVVRGDSERHGREERRARLSRFDELTGELNRAHLIETLAATLEEATRYRASCGLLIVAIDNLASIDELHGLAIADEVVVSMAKNIRARLRGGDTLGRLSGNGFGVVLKNCTSDDMAAAAERILAIARDTVVTTTAGGVVATVTIGGIVAPRHARTVDDILARAQESLEAAKSGQCGMYQAPCRATSVKAEALPSAVGAIASTSSRSIARSS